MTAAAAALPAPSFAIRPYRADTDEAFVYDSFLRSYRGSEHTRGMTNTLYLDVYKHEWQAVLDSFTVLVAHPESDDDEIAGYVAFRGRCLAWVYVKRTPWRGMGVSRLLMDAAGFRPGSPVWALFPYRQGMERLERSGGYTFLLTPHVEALRLLEGVA